jgi:hypothetical protein
MRQATRSRQKASGRARSPLDDFSALSTHRAGLRVDRSDDADRERAATPRASGSPFRARSRRVFRTYPPPCMLPQGFDPLCQFGQFCNALSQYARRSTSHRAVGPSCFCQLHLHSRRHDLGQNAMDHSEQFSVGPTRCAVNPSPHRIRNPPWQ